MDCYYVAVRMYSSVLILTYTRVRGKFNRHGCGERGDMRVPALRHLWCSHSLLTTRNALALGMLSVTVQSFYAGQHGTWAFNV